MARMSWRGALGCVLGAGLGAGCAAGSEPEYLSGPAPVLELRHVVAERSVPHAPTREPPRVDGAPSEIERELGLRWRFRGGSPSPGVAIGPDGTVYVPTHEGHVHAVAADGQFRWSFNCHAPATGAAVTPSGVLLVGTTDGVLHAILPGGTGLWAYRAPHPLTTPLAVGRDGTAYVGDRSDHLVAVSSYGGARWRAPIQGSISAGPVLLPDGGILVGTGAAELLWVDGVLKRRQVTLPATVVQAPEILDDGTVVALAGRLLVGVRQGREVWRVEAVDAVAAATGGCVTVGAAGLCRRDLDGRASSCSPFEWVASARPLAEPDGWVYVPTGQGELVVVAPDGRVQRVVTVARTALWAPAVDEERGQVLAAAGDGVVGAVALRLVEGG
jgi:outer membrane protein assembly factor BamB